MTDQAPELLPKCTCGYWRAARLNHADDCPVATFDLNDPRPIWEQGHTAERPVAQVRGALERLRDGGLEEALPSPARENPFSTLADLEAYWCSRFAAVDARIRNIATTALTAERPETAVARESNWQPIATALHKDGTRILAWDGKEQFTCFYRGEHHESYQDKPGWFDQHIRMFPTHWKPLGPSPTKRRVPVDRLSKVSK